jgi:hypothetical protein
MLVDVRFGAAADAGSTPAASTTEYGKGRGNAALAAKDVMSLVNSRSG